MTPTKLLTLTLSVVLIAVAVVLGVISVIEGRGTVWLPAIYAVLASGLLVSGVVIAVKGK